MFVRVCACVCVVCVCACLCVRCNVIYYLGQFVRVFVFYNMACVLLVYVYTVCTYTHVCRYMRVLY